MSRAPFEERFWSRVDKTDGGCWNWVGKLDATGYSQKIVNPLCRDTRAHRLAYMMMVGPIPDGLVLDHLCRNRACCNPEHLEPVTPEENIRRGVEARWYELCPNGHDPAEWRRTVGDKNLCIACRRESDRRRDERHRERRRAAARARYWAQRQGGAA